MTEATALTLRRHLQVSLAMVVDELGRSLLISQCGTEPKRAMEALLDLVMDRWIELGGDLLVSTSVSERLECS